ncbi:DUF6912 family protein [Thermomonospora cellulosilytica]|uniref:Uncharacterized protein n=1 Tax=Thermomonospora cellulosilytica TaxID=1411118 RepID=A0A7W3RD18_9ACTN|nr:hypothetical protein [Thermomonospora cellulosilytica]MBA9007860.1 hypothetical protein [Thermomonospora cellulosilytica]
MRVYLPSTLVRLARDLAAGEIGPAPLPGYAVTPELREWYAEGDTEELEYAAMTAAARASLRLLAVDQAEDPKVPPRRVVLAVEVPEQAVQRDAAGGERALVQVNAPVLARDIAAGHVDDEQAAEDVQAAIKALPDADAGDEDARFVVDGAEGHELLWYATQELADL